MKCYACVSEHKMFVVKKGNGTLAPGSVEPDVLEADTMVPAWQQKQIGNQLVMGCVALPVCESRHMEVNELSAVDRAMMGGKILPGARGIG